MDARSDSALNNTVETIRFTPNNNVDIPAAFQDVEVQLRAAIQRLLQQHRNIRGYITSNVTFSRVNDGQVIYHQQLFRSRIQVLSNEIDIEDTLAEMMREIFERSQDFQAQGSGWSLVSVDNIELHMAQYKPLDASSYIRLPKEIELTKAVLNIQNEDNKCIVWAILAFLHPVNSKDNPKRVTKYQPYEHELNCTGVSFPTPLKDIKKIEQQNNISIHVFGYDVKEKVYPLLLSKKVIQDRHINLLLIGDGENRHYCLIRTFSRLMNQRTKHKGSQFFCYNCLHSFSSHKTLEKHVELCYKQNSQATKLPENDKDKEVSFNGLQKQLPVPFVIYADLESYTEKIDHCLPDPTRSSTTEYQRHTPSGFFYMMVSTVDGHTKRTVLYRGPNGIETFFERSSLSYRRIQLNKPYSCNCCAHATYTRRNRT